MSKYTPDRWVLTTMTYPDGAVADRVFGGWYGGYGGSNSWKLSSGVTDIQDKGTHYEATNVSGSVYILQKECEGMSGYMSFIWETLKARAQISIKEIQT